MPTYLLFPHRADCAPRTTDCASHFTDRTGRPIPILPEGKPIEELG